MALLIATAPAASQGARTPQAALRAAIDTEMLKGDLADAIRQYRQIVDKFAKTDRPIASQALLKLAECYQKLGDSQVRSAYERLASDFADQPEAQTARGRLAALVPAQAAGPFPEVSFPELPQYDKVFSPDGKFAVFQRRTGTNAAMETSIIARDLHTGQDKTIAGGLKALPGFIHVTPDSQWIVMLARPLTPVEGLYRELLVIAPMTPGARPVKILETTADNSKAIADWPPLNIGLNRGARAISPNGRLLAYLAPTDSPDRFDVRLFEFASASSNSLDTSVGRRNGWIDFQWTPASDELAMRVTDNEKGLEEVRIVNVASRQSRSVALRTPTGFRARFEALTSRGELVVREQPTAKGESANVVLVNLTSGDRRTICSSPAVTVTESDRRDGFQYINMDLCLGLSSDGGRQILWKAESKQIIVRDTRTGKDQPLTRASGEEKPGFLSPDGRVEVFAANRDGKWALYAASIDQAPVAVPAVIARFDGLPNFVQPVQWISGGIALSLRFSEDHINRVTMDPASGRSTGELERLTQESLQNWAPTISPDGREIAYWSERGLSVMDAGTGANERVVIARPPRITSGPVQWRTIDEVLTLIGRPDGSREITSINVRTRVVAPVLFRGEPHAIRVHTGAWDYARSTNEIFYVAEVEGLRNAREIRVHSLVDGSDRTGGRIEEPEGTIYDIRVSPDGKRIVYLLNNSLNKAPKAAELGILTIGEPGRRVLFNPDGAPAPAAFSPDGRFLLFGGQRPRIMDLESTKEWPLMNDPAKQPLWGEEAWASWSPDGKFISLVVGTTKDQLRLWTGLTAEGVEKQTKR